jgi:hypothetical protein
LSTKITVCKGVSHHAQIHPPVLKEGSQNPGCQVLEVLLAAGFGTASRNKPEDASNLRFPGVRKGRNAYLEVPFRTVKKTGFSRQRQSEKSGLLVLS